MSRTKRGEKDPVTLNAMANHRILEEVYSGPHRWEETDSIIGTKQRRKKRRGNKGLLSAAV